MNELSARTTIPYYLSLISALLMIAVLYLQGRLWWCELGDYRIYVNEAWKSGHTSQHFFDPYSFTHVLHGVLFFWLAGLLFSRLSIHWRFFIAMLAEAGWEIFENTDFIIEKYRANTAALDYFGDSIMNSVGDLAACAAGFWIAFKLGWWRSLIFFIAVEVVLLLSIRDSLLLNILLLLFPLDSVKNWQSG